MARLTVDLFSDALEVATTVTVIWPQVTEHQAGVAVSGRPSAARPGPH